LKIAGLFVVFAMMMSMETSVASNLKPVAVIASPLSGSTHMHKGSISFSSAGSQDPDGYITARRWYIDGVFFSSWSSPNYSVALNPGEHSRTVTIGLEVRDDDNTWSVRTYRTITISLSGRTEYYLTDHLGSVRTTIDQNGFVLGYDDFDPFGNVLTGRSSNFATPNDDNKFTGHERDTEGGINLDYMLARLYDSEIGKFYSNDPKHYLYSSLSPYAYVANNPLIAIDPDGMQIQVIGSDKSVYTYQDNTFVDKDGNEYKGDDKFLNSILTSLNNLMEMDGISDMIKELTDSKDFIHTIQLGNKNEATPRSKPERWDADLKGKKVGSFVFITQETLNGNHTIEDNLPTTIETTVAHELSHSSDFQNGRMKGELTIGGTVGTVNSKTEISAVKVENIVRNKQNLPKRETYGGKKINFN
jgi:RHS repeat-associated protein